MINLFFRQFYWQNRILKTIVIAVERNRAKRRIRHAIKEVLPKYGKNGYDYVVVATIKTNKVSWKTILNDLEKAFREIKQ